MTHLLIRTDASPRIGWGHFMRCLAVAQAWRDRGGMVKFVASGLEATLAGFLHREQIECFEVNGEPGSEEDAAAASKYALEVGCGACLLDGYSFGDRYRSTLREGDIFLAGFDDNGETGGRSLDLLLNYNAHATVKLYPDRNQACELLLGPRYAPLRREFSQSNTKRHPISARPRILVLFGGTDPLQRGASIARHLAESINSEVEVILVSGSSQPTDATPSTYSRLRCIGRPDNMANLMQGVDLAVSAGGFSLYELLSFGIPVVTVGVAENQVGSLRALSSKNALIYLGMGGAVDDLFVAEQVAKLIEDAELRASLSANALELQIGGGAARVAAAIEQRITHYTGSSFI